MIDDSEGVRFLQWCLPRLRLRWPGFRKVRRTVYKRLARRLRELGLSSLEAYRLYLKNHPREWEALDALCWIPISRFYRDRSVFQVIEKELFPRAAAMAAAAREDEVRCWCAGCAGGEEPYTLAIIWKERLDAQFPAQRLRIVATDIDPLAIERARRACYGAGSLKDLPADWREKAFVASGDEFCLRPEYRDRVDFMRQDLREEAPDGLFHLILCRNLAFTYFDQTLQSETVRKISLRLIGGGFLVIGSLERLPTGGEELEPWGSSGIYRKKQQDRPEIAQ